MKHIRVLERGVAVVRALQGRPGMSLGELHEATGLPKATLLRILATFEDQGWVWRAQGDGLYRNAVELREFGSMQNKFRHLAEAAVPHLEALHHKVVWPSDLTVRHGYFMELIETSRPHCSLSLNRDQIGQKIDMLWSAVGRAYLAWCPLPEREKIIAYLQSHPAARTDKGLFDLARMNQVLEQTRVRGYGLREAKYGGRDKAIGEYDDGLDAIAIPVMHGAKVLGCINIVWLKKVGLEKQMVRKHLADLRNAAAAIAATFAAAAGAGRRGAGSQTDTPLFDLVK